MGSFQDVNEEHFKVFFNSERIKRKNLRDTFTLVNLTSVTYVTDVSELIMARLSQSVRPI